MLEGMIGLTRPHHTEAKSLTLTPSATLLGAEWGSVRSVGRYETPLCLQQLGLVAPDEFVQARGGLSMRESER